MRILSKPDPTAATQDERAKLVAAQTKLAELEAARAAKLPETDDLASIEEIDRRIAAQRHAVRIHTDRIAALAGQRRRLEADQREQQRSAAIAAIGKKLARRNALAAELESTAARCAELYVALSNTAPVPADFPFSVPRWFAWTIVDSIGQGVLQLLHRRTREASAGIFSSDFSGLLTSRSGAKNISADVAADSDRLLAALRKVPLPDIATDEDEEVAA